MERHVQRGRVILGRVLAGRPRRIHQIRFNSQEVAFSERNIAQVFDTADQQLTLLRTQRTALDRQKRGLMQRLLTGKLRVRTA